MRDDEARIEAQRENRAGPNIFKPHIIGIIVQMWEGSAVIERDRIVAYYEFRLGLVCSH